MARYTIDRIEDGDWAVLQDERARTFTVPRHWLPESARESDVLRSTEQADGASASVVRLELDLAVRDERLTKARDRLDALPRGPKGDVSL